MSEILKRCPLIDLELCERARPGPNQCPVIQRTDKFALERHEVEFDSQVSNAEFETREIVFHDLIDAARNSPSGVNMPQTLRDLKEKMRGF